MARPIIALSILGVLLLLSVVVFFQTRTEGFQVQGNVDGPIPLAAQSSMVPTDTPGATSTDPTKSKPQGVDVLALMETVKNFRLLVAALDPSRTNLPSDQKAQISSLRDQADDVENNLQAALVNSNATPYSVEDVSRLNAQYTKAIGQLRQATEAIPQGRQPLEKQPTIPDNLATPPTVQTAPSSAITLQALQNLTRRIQEESLRLTNLRSTSPTVLTRIDHLDKLAADLGDMIDAVQQGTTNLSDLPIKPSDADAFLASLGGNEGALPPLMTPKASSNVEPEASHPATKMASIQTLLDQAKHLKWGIDINIGYDPKVKQRERALGILERIEQALTKHAVSDTPITPDQIRSYVKQLNALSGLGTPSTKAVPLDPLPSMATRTAGEAEYPTAEQVQSVQGDGFGPSSYDDYAVDTFPKPGDSSADTNKRPGFTMNTESIERRGSASAFDPAAVGGPDYKKRVQDLCKQIQGAQLGDPASFGCLPNPDEVSASYSWKGNYQMVCSRLGDTWGGWYPEMFGCPKPDPTAKFGTSMM